MRLRSGEADSLDRHLQHDELVVHLRSEAERQHAEHLAHLNPFALWLHRPVVAVPVLAAYVLLTVFAFSVRADAVCTTLVAATVVLAVADWHNFRTFHGKVSWPLLKLNHPALYWWLIVGMVVFFFVPATAYLVQCLQTADKVREGQRARLRTDIARLEQELHLMPPGANERDTLER